MSSPFKICVIGCGGIAHSQHGPAYARYAAERPGAELAACCDLDGQKAENFAGQFGFRRSYRDWHEMLRFEGPDAVCLNVPPEITPSLAVPILRMGIPVMLEKPPGLTVDETDEMIRAAEESSAPHQVAFNRRFTPLVQELKRLLAEELPGYPIQHIRYDFTRIGRTDPDFTTTAIHGIDAVRNLAGCDYTQVWFQYQEQNYQGNPVTNFFLNCTLASGASAQLSFLPASGAVLERATIHLQEHLFLLHLPVWNGLDAPGWLQWVQRGEIRRQLSGPELSQSNQDYVLNGFWGENAAFFDDIRQRRRPLCDLRSTRQSVAIAQYLRERQPVYPAHRF